MSDQKRFPDNGFIAAHCEPDGSLVGSSPKFSVVSELVASKALFRGRLTLVMWEGDPFRMRNMRYSHARTLSPPLFHDTIKG